MNIEQKTHKDSASFVESVLQNLRENGANVSSLHEFILLKSKPKQAVQALLNLLSSDLDLESKEIIVRTLSVKDIGDMTMKPLVELYNATAKTKESFRWAIGNAMSIYVIDSVLNDVISIVKDVSNGKSREMFALSLGNVKLPGSRTNAIQCLSGLLTTEDEVAGHALMALRKLKATEARRAIEPYLVNKKSWWRNEAKKTIAKFDK